MKNHKIFLVLLLFAFLFLCSLSLMRSQLKSVISPIENPAASTFTVVIDAGHGGFDSGKVGVDGSLEKTINLSIAKKLERLLLAADINTVMIRREDLELCTETDSNKKRADLQKRVSLMNDANADCIISIHQNSYPQESIHGAQVFYYTHSESGKHLAVFLQNALRTGVDPDNHRTEKANDTYYLLKNVSAPTVIAECGFLSNWAESKKLVDDTYQQKLAWAIHLGILQYLNDLSNH